MNHKLKHIFNQFQVVAKFMDFCELNSGHINDTYFIQTAQKPNYVLQKINGTVFKNAKQLISNKVLVSKYLQEKNVHLPLHKLQKKVLCFVVSKRGSYFYKDTLGDYWNLSIFIENSITYERTPNSKIAFEAGKATGEFLALTKDFDVKKLNDILPNFHSVNKRFLEFKDALDNTTVERKKQAKKLIAFANFHLEEMLELDHAIRDKIVPLRLTHNDTKISNILFSKNQKSLCMIDTDTVMKGLLHFDYGDAIRTICNTLDEDSLEINKIEFNEEYFKKYTRGFLQELKENITLEELKYLPVSIKIMPFIMGLRFLTDFLNGNVYYKTAYKFHNFNRSQNQFTLVEKIKEKYSTIESFFKT